MKKFIQTIKDIWSIEELRNKILLTLGFMAIYRLAAQVPLPGIDITVAQAALKNQTSGGGILGLLDMFTGGAFAQASIVALGIMPYISASIVVQLMGIAVPYLQKLQKDGESGRKKINQITRWLTIAITMVQGPAYITNIYQLIPSEAFYISGSMFWLSSMVILTAGTIFAMWLGEKITDKGIGNGISLLIMIGIIARFPSSFIQEVVSKVTASNGGLIMILLEVIVWFLVILVCVYLVTAVRRIAVQYARKTVAGNIKNVAGSRDYIPLKLNSSGVMPIIFAQAIMFAPALMANSDNNTIKSIGIEFSNMFGLWYNLLFAFLIIVFSYFYTAITIPTNKMADDLKRSGGFIPGIRPGKDTGELLDRVLSLITFPGSIFLALVAILPAIVVKFGLTQSWALFYGGTSLLIMVGVAIDTIQQINSHLLNRHYDGLMKKGTKRKSVA
ncbi:MAG: preprotein translocase subunit SecY [Lutibacter sp.]|uniref:preprotein translocase subunit SecY n=1 Tax=Lutibacter sp. TaxID=1925666 RepID=UPI001817DE81|nr:preprotein translocase subunit SecY [Lutibacter sp.]MBT8316278.1 preprotein translocase subunit SecY [Lutibacter sp.]NNJ57138.1 preprotein translocase subunit SecY [Lutibacter sp.]